LQKRDYIGVLIIDKSVYLRPVGYATQDNSLGVPGFLSSMFQEGCVRVAIDLKDCMGMDSTFLGVIAHAATNLPRHGGSPVTILNASEKDIREFATVGLLSLVEVIDSPVEPPEGLELLEIDFVHFPNTERERIQQVKYLHEQLAKLNERNKKNFSSFLSMLQEELGQANDGQRATSL